MAPVLSRSLLTASLTSLPLSTPFSFKNPRGSLNLRSVFLPPNGLKKGLSCSGLNWKLEKGNNRIAVRCEAAVAEKEETESSGEKFEYQAEVGLFSFHEFWVFQPFGFRLSLWFHKIQK